MTVDFITQVSRNRIRFDCSVANAGTRQGIMSPKMRGKVDYCYTVLIHFQEVSPWENKGSFVYFLSNNDKIDVQNSLKCQDLALGLQT